MSNINSPNEAAATRRDVCNQLFERARADVPAWTVELGLDSKYMATLDELEHEMLARMDAVVTGTPVSASSRPIVCSSPPSVEQLLEHSVLEGQNILETWNMVERVRAHRERLHANGAVARAAFYEAAEAQLMASHDESIRLLREYQVLLGHPTSLPPMARSSKRAPATKEEQALARDLDRAPRDLESLMTMKSFSLRLMAHAAGLMDTAEQKIAWHDIAVQDERARYVLAGVLRWDYLQHRRNAVAEK